MTTLNNADYNQSINGEELGWYVDDIGYDKLTNRQLHPIQSYDDVVYATYEEQGNRSYTTPEDYLEVRNYFGSNTDILPATENIIKSRSEAERRHDYFESRNIGRIDKGDDPAIFDRNLLRGEPTQWDRRDPNQFARQMTKERDYMNNRQINMAPDYSSIRKWGNIVNPRKLSEREKYKEREWGNKEDGMAIASQSYLHHRGEADTLISPYMNKPIGYKSDNPERSNISTNFKEYDDMYAKEHFTSLTKKESPYKYIITEFNQKYEHELQQPHYFIKKMDKNEFKTNVIYEQTNKLEILMKAKGYKQYEIDHEKKMLEIELNDKIDLYFNNPQGYKQKISKVENFSILNEIQKLNIEFNEILKSFKPKIETKQEFSVDHLQKTSTEVNVREYKERLIKEKESFDIDVKNIPITELENKIQRMKEIKQRMNNLIIENNNKEIIELENKIHKIKNESKQQFSIQTPTKHIPEIEQYIKKRNELKEKNKYIINANTKQVEEFNIMSTKLRKSREQGKSELTYKERLELIRNNKPSIQIKIKPIDKFDLNINRSKEREEKQQNKRKTKKISLLENVNVNEY